MNGPTLDGHDDRIPDSTLAKLHGLWEALPETWNHRVTMATKRTATIVLTFTDGDAVSNAAAAERMMTAVECFGALERNLRWEREQNT